HIAVAYDGTTLKLYLDGSLDREQSVSGVSANVGGGLITLARNVYGADQYDGFIDEVRIWKRARTAEEILANMGGEFSSDPGIPPPAPATCTATDTSAALVDFSWADVASETGYLVYRDGVQVDSV